MSYPRERGRVDGVRVIRGLRSECSMELKYECLQF